MSRHTGSCHCGNVRFEVDADLAKGASRCNCTLCIRRGATVTIVKPAAFRLLSGDVAEYAREGGVNHFNFCKRCGIHVFGGGNLPELGGEFVSVNVNCLDQVDPESLQLIYWDGRHNNWDAGPRPQPWPI